MLLKHTYQHPKERTNFASFEILHATFAAFRPPILDDGPESARAMAGASGGARSESCEPVTSGTCRWPHGSANGCGMLWHVVACCGMLWALEMARMGVRMSKDV